jgi:hypothetical protein
VEFEPQHFQQMAGLVCYYHSSKFHYFYVSRDDQGGKHVRVMSALPDQVTSDAFTSPIAIADRVSIELRVEVDYERLRFAELHRCVRRNGLSGSFRDGDARGFRLVRVPRARVRHRCVTVE